LNLLVSGQNPSHNSMKIKYEIGVLTQQQKHLNWLVVYKSIKE